MEQTNYEFYEFLVNVDEKHKDFVINVNDMLLKKGCKVKIVSSKTSLFNVKYTMGKTRRGIFNFTLTKKGLKVSVYASSYEKYPDVLNNLHEDVVKQIAESPICKNMTGPKKCSWADCIGYDIRIGGEHYEKCRYSCFKFDVEPETIPSLLKLLESECKERAIS
ncbi:MAG: hypothetical protein FWC32_06775 [Firmicutes bacterium]|nr:hypothetical protein [Bacillota bacterium]